MRLPAYLMIALAATTLVFGMAAGTTAQELEQQGYIATLQPLNQRAAGGDVTGQVLITEAGDKITFQVTVQNVPPDIQHWQHIHGFASGDQAAACPTGDADTNDDGYIDLKETEGSAGTTMIPLNADPVGFDVTADTYPKANSDGTYTWEVTVTKGDLEDAFGQHFPDAGGLNFDNRVVFIHGVPEGTTLPDTVQSIDDVPATTTLPIACGTLQAAEAGTPVATPIASPDATPAA